MPKAAPASDKPKNVTIYGRLSYPVWTAQSAYDKSQGSKFPAKSVADAKPDFNLLIEQPQLDKLMAKIRDEFLPYCIQQHATGEKRDVLDKDEVDSLLEQLAKPQFGGKKTIYNTPISMVPEKTAPSVPEAVASIKCIGNAGVDIELKAVVNEEGELAVPDPDILQFPVIKKLSESVHSMYAGALVAVTINLYAYHNGNLPGFSAGASVAVFKADADRIGGGVAVDEDAIFADD